MAFFHGLFTVLASLAFLANCSTVARGATQSVSELQERFDREQNAVHKAKLIQKLGDAQFDALHAAEDYNTAGVILEKYRDNVRAALAGLKKAQPDAERKSNGYRQLQMHVRRGIREVQEALLSAPEEVQPPLQLVRQDLIDADDELLRLLFPLPPEPKRGAKPDATPSTKPNSQGAQP